MFDGTLDSNHIHGLKEVLRHQCKEFTQDHAEQGLTYDAFEAL